MSALAGLFAEGHAADIVLAVMAAELALLLLAGHDPRRLLASLLPGALMVVALRAALTGADWRWVAVPLALSLPFHLADLRLRGLLFVHGAQPRFSRLRAKEKHRSTRDENVPDSGGKWRGA